MKTLTLTAALVLISGPALADHMAEAIAHFNLDLAPSEQIVMTPTGGEDVVFSTRGMSVQSAIDVLNGSRDLNEQIDGATLFASQPTYGADIFAEIAAESDD